MSIETLIQDILSIEQEITDALEQDDFDRANDLMEKRNSIIIELSQTKTEDEYEKALLSQFANSLTEFTKERNQELFNEREKTRLELIKLKKGSNGLNKYTQVRNGSF